ncbi:MAG: ABC transporter ATP-binding protein [Pseudomonadota bacterium]
MTLQVRGLVSGYGAGHVINGLDLELAPGEILAVMGRNGMGKTTLLRTLIGQATIVAGAITLDGRSLIGLPGHEIARAGLGYVPQGRAIFNDLTVADNLRLGRFARTAASSSPADNTKMFPILAERAGQRAGTLSGGEQQQLAIARALAGEPRILLLDEPSEGIQPSIVETIGKLLRKLADERNIGVLLVEQQLDLTLDVADCVVLLEKGKIRHAFTRNDLAVGTYQLTAELGI